MLILPLYFIFIQTFVTFWTFLEMFHSSACIQHDDSITVLLLNLPTCRQSSSGSCLITGFPETIHQYWRSTLTIIWSQKRLILTSKQHALYYFQKVSDYIFLSTLGLLLPLSLCRNSFRSEKMKRQNVLHHPFTLKYSFLANLTILTLWWIPQKNNFLNRLPASLKYKREILWDTECK